MFMPGEAFLYAAIELDGALIEEALKNRVIIATPTTLMAVLRAIEFGWRQEEITANAGRNSQARKRFVRPNLGAREPFLPSWARIWRQAVGAYNTALGSLETRVLVTARKIGELGARSDKELPDAEAIDVRPRELPPTMRALNNQTDEAVASPIPGGT